MKACKERRWQLDWVDSPSETALTERIVPLRYVRELTAQERAALTELYKTSPEVEVGHRSHAILLSADGWRVTKIAELLRVDQSTVHRWLDRFEAAGRRAWRVNGAMADRQPGMKVTNGCWLRPCAMIHAGTGWSNRCGRAAAGRLSGRADRRAPECRARPGALALPWSTSQAAHPSRA